MANHAFQTTPNYDAKRGLYVTNEFLLGYDIDGNLLLYWRDYFCYNESQYKTVELTLENWQEYFEIRPCTHGALYSSFGEFERLDYVNWALYLKEDVADTVIDMEDAAIEYSFRDGYFCRFEYNLDTGEFVQKEAAVPGEIDSNLKVTDSARDLRINLASAKEDGCFLVFISRHLAESLNGNIYSFVGEAYATMEIVRIKGTLTVTK